MGELHQQEDHREIEEARSQLELLVRDGLFTPETKDFFELLQHYDSVDSWRKKWADEDYRLIAPPETFVRRRRFSLRAVLSS